MYTLGIIPSLIREARPAGTVYDPAKDVPDLSGKVIIVTGTLSLFQLEASLPRR